MGAPGVPLGKQLQHKHPPASLNSKNVKCTFENITSGLHDVVFFGVGSPFVSLFQGGRVVMQMIWRELENLGEYRSDRVKRKETKHMTNFKHVLFVQLFGIPSLLKEVSLPCACEHQGHHLLSQPLKCLGFIWDNWSCSINRFSVILTLSMKRII